MRTHDPSPEPDPIAGHRYTLPRVREIPRSGTEVKPPAAERQRARVLASLIVVPGVPGGKR
jgi:hypothetical protein